MTCIIFSSQLFSIATRDTPAKLFVRYIIRDARFCHILHLRSITLQPRACARARWEQLKREKSKQLSLKGAI